MNITCWYKNGSLKAFRQFCIQNQYKQIFIRLKNRSDPVVGALHSHCSDSAKAAHLFLLLNEKVIHPAYYGIDGIDCLHIGSDEVLLPLAGSRYSAEMYLPKIIDSMN
jgi:hypothetical protein